MNDQLISELESHIAVHILRQPGRRIDAEEPIISSGLIGSFNLVDVALHVEEAYGVHIADTELDSGTFDTLSQLAVLIEQRRAS